MLELPHREFHDVSHMSQYCFNGAFDQYYQLFSKYLILHPPYQDLF